MQVGPSFYKRAVCDGIEARRRLLALKDALLGLRLVRGDCEDPLIGLEGCYNDPR